MRPSPGCTIWASAGWRISMPRGAGRSQPRATYSPELVDIFPKSFAVVTGVTLLCFHVARWRQSPQRIAGAFFVNNNNPAWMTRSLACLLVICTSAFVGQASASTTQQILDRVMVFSPNGVINLATGNTIRPPDFTDLEISGSSFSTCALTAVNGLYCLDGKSLRNWVNPTSINLGVEVLNCADPALKLDNKPDACTGMTVDQSGAIWLA